MRRSLVLLLVPLVLGLLGGCTADGARIAAARELVGDLAVALADRRVGDLALEGGGQEQLDAVVAGMSGIPATVSAGEVGVDGDTAEATLAWSWETPAGPWAYEVPVELRWLDSQWWARWTPALVEPSLGPGEALEAVVRQARRGDILGAGDRPLVTSRPVVRFGIDRSRVSPPDAPAAARQLAGLLGIAPGPYAKRVRQAGPRAFVEALVLRAGDARRVDRPALDAIPGAIGVSGEMPLAPTRDFAAAILGRVGPATAEILEGSGGAVRPGDEVGRSGLQARYDSQLAGRPSVEVAAVGGPASRTLFSAAAVDGQPLRTTLDVGLQGDAEAALAAVEPASALVALRPSTGEILAAASGPGSRGYNTATFGRYPPGSTMKVVTALALMRAGVQPSDPVPCTARVVVDGKPFTNYDGYPASRMGRISLESAVANSCNTALISQRAKLGGDDLTEAAAALGLGVDHDLGFPAYFGQVPEPASQVEKAAALIGQGTVLASPMAMAAVAASVAEGRAVVPRLLIAAPEPEVDPAQPLTPAEAAALQAMMRAVVAGGTAAFLDDVPGPPVGAKTGTAEFGTRLPLRTHAWMIATQGDLAVAVFVEEGQSGSQTAGPILERFLRAAR